jgi:hypothetical protein
MREFTGLRCALFACALATGCYGPFSCAEWRSDSYSEDIDASEDGAQALLRLARRPGRAEQGFSELPTRGNLRLITPKPFRRQPEGWDKITRTLLEFRTCSDRQWNFTGGEGAHALAWEDERYRGARAYRRPEVNNGGPFLESTTILYATPHFTTTGKEAFNSIYSGRFGDRSIPLALVAKLGRAWACLPIPDEEPDIPVPPLSEPDFEVAELAASATFAGVELFGWESSEGWAYALIRAKAPKGRSPLVVAAGVTLEELLPVLAEVPPDSELRWTRLSMGDAAGDLTSVSPAHEQIRAALQSVGSRLTP